MKVKAELDNLRKKEAKTLLSDLEKERLELARERIAVKLGKLSKIHQVKNRKERIARMMTVLSEKVRGRA